MQDNCKSIVSYETEDIAENKCLFNNEFNLLNSITDAIQGQVDQIGHMEQERNSNDNERLNALLEKCMEEYLTAVNQK